MVRYRQIFRNNYTWYLNVLHLVIKKIIKNFLHMNLRDSDELKTNTEISQTGQIVFMPAKHSLKLLWAEIKCIRADCQINGGSITETTS